MPRPLVQLGTTGPDVMDAILRLNLAGADPQVPPTDTFGPDGKAAAESFQSAHGLGVDGQIGGNTWPLLDQLDGGRLVAGTDVPTIMADRDQARDALHNSDFAGAKNLLEPWYATEGVPPEVRVSLVAGLGWAEHGLGNLDRARALYIEQVAIVMILGASPLVLRDTIQRLREVTLGLAPGPVPSQVNKQNLPPNG
jgi:hypothetical protein